MSDLEILDAVSVFNDCVQEKPWLDVDVIECSEQSVIIHCGIDLSVGPDIRIEFGTIFFLSLFMTWKTDTSLPVLRVLTGDEAILINKQYRVESGYHLFAFQPEDMAHGVRCIIAAKTFRWLPFAPT